jgi:tetratricopeptide (TPR) repeat protein
MLLNHPAEAVPAIQRAIDLKSDYTDAYLAMGMALQSSGRPDGAKAAYSRAVQIDPSLQAAQEHLSRIAATQGAVRQK